MAKPSLTCFDARAIERFWAYLPHRPLGECWEWHGGRTKRGYGIFHIKSSSFRAHRVALYLKTGDMPADLCGLHACDNPPCCNPDHLRWGSAVENEQDKVERGRVRGERNSRAKITAHDSEFIRTSDRSTAWLMAAFDLSKPQVNRIRRGVSWVLRELG